MRIEADLRNIHHATVPVAGDVWRERGTVDILLVLESNALTVNYCTPQDDGGGWDIDNPIECTREQFTHLMEYHTIPNQFWADAYPNGAPDTMSALKKALDATAEYT